VGNRKKNNPAVMDPSFGGRVPLEWNPREDYPNGMLIVNDEIIHP
jgi:hypothetical protein